MAQQASSRAGPAQHVVAMFLEVLPAAEYLVAGDPEWLRALLSAYNSAYAFGFRVMVTLLISLMIIASPFIGFGACAFAFMVSIARQAASLVGRNLADSIGYGDFIRAYALYYAKKRQEHAGRVAVRLPASGATATTRYPAMLEDELGLFSVDACWAAPVKVFNAGFSGGYVAATVLLCALTFVAAPFIGMFLAGAQIYYSVFRVFTRSEGKLLMDLLGVREAVDQHTAFMLEEVGVEDPHTTHPNGSSGGGGYGTAAVTTVVFAPGAGAPFIRSDMQQSMPAMSVAAPPPVYMMPPPPAQAQHAPVPSPYSHAAYAPAPAATAPSMYPSIYQHSEDPSAAKM